jgi:hypothetical protein
LNEFSIDTEKAEEKKALDIEGSDNTFRNEEFLTTC